MSPTISKWRIIKHFLKSLKYPKFFILNTRKKPSIYTHLMNLRKTLPLFPLPTDLPLY